MDITIFYSHQDKNFATDLYKRLSSDNYRPYLLEIRNDDLELYQADNRDALKADTAIFVISPHQNEKNTIGRNTYRNVEISTLLDVLFEKGSPLIIPLILGKNTNIPHELVKYRRIFVPFPDDNTTQSTSKGEADPTGKENAINTIRTILASKSEIKESEKQRQQQIKDNVTASLAINIRGMLRKMEKSEITNRLFASILYIITVLGLLSTFLVISNYFQKDINEPNLETFAMKGVICIIILAIIVAVAKLFYSLAKSIMVESLRCADRIHAINFGLFMLEAYGTKLTHNEVMTAFGNWNIDNGDFVFKNLSADDIDPKILDAISSVTGLKK